jgi:hypothetical protein
VLWEEQTQDAPTKKKTIHQKSCATPTPTTSIETTSSPTRQEVSKHPAQRASTFRDRRPDVPPLKLEPQRRTTQPPTAQAAPGKLLVDHGRRTNIRGRRPGLKVKLPHLRQHRPSRQPRRTSNTRQSPNPCKQQLRLMKLLPTMYPEAAASTHNHHPGPLPRRPRTSTQEKPHTTAN